MTPENLSQQLAQARKAVSLLRNAVQLLEACGVATAVDQSKLALSAAISVAEELKTKTKAAAKKRQRVVVAMPSDKASLIRDDGTLRYVGYMKEAGNRPAVVAVSFRTPGLPPLATSFSLVGRDFDGVYEAAVQALAAHLGLTDDVALMESMLSTKCAFKVRYGLAGCLSHGGIHEN